MLPFCSICVVQWLSAVFACLARPLWLCQARRLHAQELKEEQRDDTSGGCRGVHEHCRIAGGQAWQPRLTKGLLWDLSLYLAASPMTPKNAKPPAR